MKKNKWLPHSILCILNLLLILSICLTYADSHGLLIPAAVTEGSFLNTALGLFDAACFLIFLVPYGLGVLILAVVDYVKERKTVPEGGKPRLRFLIAALPAFLLTLAVKYVYLVALSVTILLPDLFHF